MTKPTKFQQQILFKEEIASEQADKNELIVTEQVVVDNDDWQLEQSAIDEAAALEVDEEHSKGSWLWRVFAVVLIAVVSIELVDFFTTGISEAPITTLLYGVLLVVVLLLSASSVIKEVSGLRQLKKRGDLRQQLAKLQASEVVEDDASNQTAELLGTITTQLAVDLTEQQKQNWQSTLEHGYSDQELIDLYSRQVLSETDQKALAEVARYSAESVVLVALSPVALLDMAIILWRNLTMVDKVAGLYGMRLGYWSRIKLVKQVITNMLYAGASEVVADVSADMLGADLLGKLSGRLAQGLGAGMLTARLGLKAIYLSRPIPFDDNAPKLSQVRKEVVGQIKQLMNGK